MNVDINPEYEHYRSTWENLFKTVAGNANASNDTFRLFGFLLFFDNDKQTDFVCGDTLDTLASNALELGIESGIANDYASLHHYNMQIFNNFKTNIENQRWIAICVKVDKCFYDFFYTNPTYELFLNCLDITDPEQTTANEVEYTLQKFWEKVTGKRERYDESFIRSFSNKAKKWSFVRREHGKIYIADPKNSLKIIRKELSQYVASE